MTISMPIAAVSTVRPGRSRAVLAPWLHMIFAALLLGLASVPASADDRGVLRDTMIQWGDYDQFKATGPNGVRACAEACAKDPRCQAWTFIRTVGQCRLKHDAGPVVANACCMSGYKAAVVSGGAGGKAETCADYARRAVSASNQNLSQGCGLAGPRWTDDFQAHYSWCMRVPRDSASAETQARSVDIARCTTSASEDAEPKCDHYARISMVQVETARKAHCAVPPNDQRWATDEAVHRQACLQAPNRFLPAEIANRETVLTACLASAGQTDQVCGAYADRALQQARDANANGCGFSGRTWSSSRALHLQWCADASPASRRAELDSRSGQLAACTQQAARREACDRYAQTAVQQGLRNQNEDCGFSGPAWSPYQDDHVAFCLQVGAAQLRTETATCDNALRQCQARGSVNAECDEYAKHAVKLSQVNQERDCGNEGDEWSRDYAAHYQFCTQSNPQERQAQLVGLRQSLFECSNDHGFTLELGF